MTAIKSLVVQNGTTKQIPDADSLLVGTGIDRSTAGDLTIGGTTATSITLGSNTIPVNIPGDVTTVGGTTFTTDATFEGNVTFGNGPSDTVTFAATTTVVSDINFGGSASYKITNLADPTASSQDAATAAWVEAQIAAIPATTPGGANTQVQFNNAGSFGGSANLTWSGTDLDVTGAVNIKGGDPRALVIRDVTDAADILFYDAAVEELTIQSSIASAVTTIGAAQFNITDSNYTAQLSVVAGTSVNVDLYAPVGSTVVPAIVSAYTDLTPIPFMLKASQVLIEDGSGFPLSLQSNNISATQLTIDSSTVLQLGGVATVNICGAYTLPVSDGTTGQVLTTDGAGVASWQTAAAGTVTGVSATAPLLSSGGATPDISIDTAGASSGDVLTYNGSAWAAAAIPPTDAQGGANAVQYANSATPTAFDGDATLFSFAEGTSTLTVSNGAANSTAITPSTVIVAEGSDGVTIIGSASAANVQVALGTDLATYGAFQLAFQTTTGTTLFNENGITSPAPFDVYAATKVTATIDGGATYLLTPDSIDALTYAASVALDLDPSLPALKSVTLTGDITFTTSNVGAARNISVRVIGDASSRNLVFPAGWTWLGGAVPTVLEGATPPKVAILSIAAFGATDSTIVASWSYDGSDVVTDVTASGPLASSGGATPDISFPSWPANASGALTNDGSGNLSWAPDAGGTVTSVDLSTTLSGITVGGNPITTSGTLTLSGTLGVASGGTGATTLTGYVSGNGTSAFTASATIPGADVSGDISGNAANVNGTVAVANGGTGVTSLTSGSLLAGNGTGAVAEIAPGSNGQVLTVVGGAWVSQALPAATDYSVVAITTAQAANTAVTVAGAAAQADVAANARVAGIVKAANSVQVLGIVTCIIESAISIAQGDVVYLSASEAGKVTKDAPGAGVIAELGIATANGSGAGGTVAVLWQPKSITVL
jgi:hypothetical protein